MTASPGIVAPPFALAHDAEGARVPEGVVLFDAHVHLFPPGVFEAIWRWFDRHAWPIRYRLHAEEVVAFQRARGVRKLAGLCYAHKPGLAEVLNRFMAELGRAHPEIVPLGTVYPGEPDAARVLREALGPLQLRGLKLHCHVQQIAADDPRLDEVYTAASDAEVPVILHAGREPSFPAYGVDTRALCSAAAVERVCQRYDKLRLIIPHLGMDELPEYERLLRTYEHLWLDTTMAIGEYFPVPVSPSLFPGMAHRMLYGTDFPNLPYAWDRELTKVLTSGLDPTTERALLYGNAAALFSI